MTAAAPARPLQRHLGTLASLLLVGLTAFALHKAFSEISLDQLAAAFARVSAPQVLLCALFTSGSFVALSGFDLLGLRHAGQQLPYRQVLAVSFIAQAISHVTGFAAVAGASVRLRLYGAAGLPPLVIGTVVLFGAVAFGLGAIGLTAAASLGAPERIAIATGLPEPGVFALGLLLLLVLGGWFALSRFRPAMRLGRLDLRIPRLRLSLGMVACAVLDLLLAAAAAWVLLPDQFALGFAAFAGLYVVAMVAGVVSHLPAGAGVFEGMLLLLLPDGPRAELLVGLLTYRLVYNLLPALLAGGMLAVIELTARR